MRILIDADACPVVALTEKIAKQYQIPVTLLCDTNHVMTSDYSDELVMQVEYLPVDWKDRYDIVNNPDKFQLYIDGKLIHSK